MWTECFVTVDVTQVKDVVSDVLSSFPEVAGAYHFGSSLGECRPDSDIDIGLIVRPEVVHSRRQLDTLVGTIVLQLHHIHGHPFDIVVLEKDSPLFAFKVIRTGKRIYECNADAVRDYIEVVSRRYGEVAPRYQRALQEVLGLQ